MKQGCLLSGLLFVLVVDWLVRQTVEGQRVGHDTGVKWVDGKVLEDLDYADDIALVSEGFDDLQEKSKRLERRAKKAGLHINVDKTEVLRVNVGDDQKVVVQGKELRDVEPFIWGV